MSILSTTAVLASSIAVKLTNIEIIDSIVGLAVSFLIIVAGARILNETKNSLLGEAPVEDMVSQIKEIVAEEKEVLGIHDLLVHNYGPGHIIAALHIEVDGKKDIFVTHDMIDNIERDLRRNCGIEATIHMDPIVTDDERINELKLRVQEVVKAIDDSIRIHDFRFVEGATHTNLIFDVVLPTELAGKDVAVQSYLNEALNQKGTYYTVITFDSDAFGAHL